MFGIDLPVVTKIGKIGGGWGSTYHGFNPIIRDRVNPSKEYSPIIGDAFEQLSKPGGGLVPVTVPPASVQQANDQAVAEYNKAAQPLDPSIAIAGGLIVAVVLYKVLH